MPKIIDYRILTSNSDIQLVSAIRFAIQEGWQPWGNVAIDYKGDLHQPMVRHAITNFEERLSNQ